jgi:hypothetical protein
LSKLGFDMADREIEQLGGAETSDGWKELYDSLMTEMRTKIDSLLTDIMRSLKLCGTPVNANPVARIYHRIR